MEISEKQRKQFEIETQKISENMAKIKNRIVVFSGKGGVGKTTVSVNLAYGLCSINRQTGLLDADVTGPNVAKMLGLIKWGETSADRIIPQNHLGVKVISFASFIPSSQPVIWRGPMRSKLLNQFLGDVEWGELDYLVADLPPGTGDEILTMTQQMKPDMAIIVTTPQELSLIDSKKAVNMAKKMGIPKIAIVENMSGFLCPECGYHIDLFGKGGGEKQAAEMNVSFLGFIPLNIDTIALADEGKPIILEKPESDISTAMMKIIERIQNL